MSSTFLARRPLAATSRPGDELVGDGISGQKCRRIRSALAHAEDPVTGSSHCCLGDLWRKRLGKSKFLAFQASSRGGMVRVQVTNDRALLGGKAVIISKGELLDKIK